MIRTTDPTPDEIRQRAEAIRLDRPPLPDEKPAKPSAKFPLTPARGGFVKKMKGRLYFLGRDPNLALRKYHALAEKLGIDPSSPARPGKPKGAHPWRGKTAAMSV